MKENLKDITFLILVRLDSVQRLENILIVTELLCKYFDTNIIIREASNYNNKILETKLKRQIDYEFKEDRDPILYKTKHFNQMINLATTPYIAIWDTDIIMEKKIIVECINRLRSNEVDVSYPYNGSCYNVSEIIRELFFKRKDIRCLYRHKNKMNLLHKQNLVGGAVLLNKQKFVSIGGENEKHYGWGNDDFDRFYRFQKLELNIYKADTCLFHLSHLRDVNSNFYNPFSKSISEREIYLIGKSSKEELLGFI